MEVKVIIEESNEDKTKRELESVVGILRRLSGPDGYPIVQLVGSRRVLNREIILPESTDWDFAMIDNAENRGFLKTMGFEEKFFGGLVESGYGDVASTEVFYKKSDSSDEPLPIQVVLKQPDYWNHVVFFWKTMAANPEVFKTQFWKSYKPSLAAEYPTTQDMVRDRINNWLTVVIPCFMA